MGRARAPARDLHPVRASPTSSRARSRRAARKTALEHAHDVVHAERVLGIYQEHAVQDWALDAPGFVMEVAKFTYFQCQFSITFGFVIWVYIWRHDAYTMLRNCLFATFMLAVPGYILFPTAPPRLLVSEHFIDPLQTAALNQQGTLVKLFGNPYAAMPSLHTATAILVGVTGVLVTRASARTPRLGALSRRRRVLDRGDGQSLLPRRRRRRRRPARGRDARDRLPGARPVLDRGDGQPLLPRHVHRHRRADGRARDRVQPAPAPGLVAQAAAPPPGLVEFSHPRGGAGRPLTGGNRRSSRPAADAASGIRPSDR